jgi:ABC-type dipeptide/oligopeptide/nickel transport system ATPase subunit
MRGQAVQRSLGAPVVLVSRGAREPWDLAAQLALGATVARYLRSVFGPVRRELAHWRERARAIPDPALAAHARAGLSKRGNMEGAALFAVLAPASARRETVRALVAFQTAYNYLDTLCEQPSADPVANGHELHRALLVALDPAASHPDYYALYPQREDGGFLVALVDTCRSALATLPSHPAVAAGAVAAAERIVSFQSLNLTERQGGHEALERWRDAHRQITPLLERLGLGERLAHRAETLSMGERQRVMIARALSTQPSLLLADEPTGSLDSQRSQEVLELLGELCRERNVAIVLVSHDPLAAGYADRVFALRDGKLSDYTA